METIVNCGMHAQFIAQESTFHDEKMDFLEDLALGLLFSFV